MEFLTSPVQENQQFVSKIPSLNIIHLVTLITIVFGFLYYKLKSNTIQNRAKTLPPGSFGFPLVGESISFVRAQKQDKTDEWMQTRFEKYGPVFKTSLLGSKVVVLTGQAGNRFVFNGGDNGISYQQPKTVVKILGKYSLFELSGAQHKLIRGAIVGFLRPESIQRLVSQMDRSVHELLLKELEGKDSVQIVKLMKKIAFYVTCSIFFGITDDKETETLLEDSSTTIKGSWAIPVDFPGTTFHTALKARARTCERISRLIEIKRKEMEEGTVDTNENIISTLLRLRDDNGDPLAEEVILDISLSLIMASHDTTAILMSLFIRHISRDDEIFEKVLQEQMEITKIKQERNEGRVSWSEIQMMKYTWKVALELMRFYPPISGNFRHTTRDINFDGFDIPKGWQLFWVASGTHLDKHIFEEPDKFDPSRFENSWKNFPPYTYVPFGAGARICPGAEFARIESMLVIHHFITRYEWKQMIPDEPITREPLPYPAMGLPVRFQLRNHTTF